MKPLLILNKPFNYLVKFDEVRENYNQFLINIKVYKVESDNKLVYLFEGIGHLCNRREPHVKSWEISQPPAFVIPYVQEIMGRVSRFLLRSTTNIRPTIFNIHLDKEL